MPLKILMINRLTKIIGTFIKSFSYIYHFLFPKKRFILPKESKALMKSDSDTKIPKIIWQTNYTNKVTLPVYINYIFNRIISPTYSYRFMNHEDRDLFLEKKVHKEFFDEYKKLTDGASQADVWRLFVLDHIGGIYIDIDAHTVWPLSKIIEPEMEHLFLKRKQKKYGYTNYFIASAPNNKYLKKSLDMIIDNIKNKRIEGGVYKLTGPKVLQLAIGEDNVNSRHSKITCIQGSFTNEYFQYLDKPKGKWIHTDRKTLLK